jgi:hypothetical protein
MSDIIDRIKTAYNLENDENLKKLLYDILIEIFKLQAESSCNRTEADRMRRVAKIKTEKLHERL